MRWKQSKLDREKLIADANENTEDDEVAPEMTKLQLKRAKQRIRKLHGDPSVAKDVDGRKYLAASVGDGPSDEYIITCIDEGFHVIESVLPVDGSDVGVENLLWCFLLRLICYGPVVHY
jgi:hypothetical protein